MNMNAKARQDIKRKLRILNHAKKSGDIAKTCRYFGISRTSFFEWRKRYEKFGEKGLIIKKPCPENHKLRTPPHIEEKIIHLRKEYHFGPARIAMFLERYHQIKISSSGVRWVFVRFGMNRLPHNAKKRSPGPKINLYEKQAPGHHVQVDVKFLTFTNKENRKIKRYQYTAIDDATRIRVLKVYSRHNQKNAIDFIDYVIEKLPFRIKTVRTDNGHEFQARFHWHLLDLGINHVYIKPGSPRLNGKVERSHRTDKEEFYQFLEDTDDVDLNKKLEEWEKYYNLHRPHTSHGGFTPYEVLRAKLENKKIQCQSSVETITSVKCPISPDCGYFFTEKYLGILFFIIEIRSSKWHRLI